MFRAPESGVSIRMYRLGHGDCFLFSYPRGGGGSPVYVLIDCGYKPGSQRYLNKASIGPTIENLRRETGGVLDLVIVTHEHQDHVNGFWKKKNPYFDEFTIKEAWFAWTEDPKDELANEIRRRYRDELLQLMGVRNQLVGLAADGAQPKILDRVNRLLELELGTDDLAGAKLSFAASDPKVSQNKLAMKLIKDKAGSENGIAFLNPGEVRAVPGTGVKSYVLGPPRSLELLRQEDPKGEESFETHEGHGFSFKDAVGAEQPRALFSKEFQIPAQEAFRKSHFKNHYGKSEDGPWEGTTREAPNDAAWRRIDGDWLAGAEELALKINSGVNNTSLVLAFELPHTKKVLLFVGDAQRGNWISWSDVDWTDPAITTKDLLARTVVYKTGHHGSHNATLDGKEESKYANLNWMGTRFTEEFVTFIPAVRGWAMEKNAPPWRHPLQSIKEALVQKSAGKVFQIDQGIPAKPDGVDEAEWQDFLNRTNENSYFVEYSVPDF